MSPNFIYSQTFTKSCIFLRKRVALFGNFGANLSQPSNVTLQFFDVRLLATAMDSTTYPSEYKLDRKIVKGMSTSELACSSQPKERMQVLSWF